MNLRHIHKSLWMFSISMMALVSSACQSAESPSPDFLRAISLKNLQDGLKKSPKSENYPPEISQLGGITQLLGFVVDRGNHDLILIGSSDPSQTALRLEDFVVAIRSAWIIYSSRVGNTINYSCPGCSIDPNNQVIKKLSQISSQIGVSSAPELSDKALEKWDVECQKPQSVRIEGIPFHCHFAHTMVEADYLMKSIVDGSDSVDIPGLMSCTDMTMEQCRYALEHDELLPSLSSYNRFWFYPDTPWFEIDDATVLIRQCSVRLLTEAMHAGGDRDPIAESFASRFSLLYEEVATRIPIFNELQGLFEFVEVAQIMKARFDEAKLPCNLDYLLYEYSVPVQHVDTTLAGRSSGRKLVVSKVTPQGQSTHYVWLTSCGGVDIACEINAFKFEQSEAPEIKGLLKAITNNKPSPERITWSFQFPGLAERKLENAIQKSNECHRSVKRVRLYYDPTGNKVEYDGSRMRIADFADRIAGINPEGRPSRFYVEVTASFPNSQTAKAAIQALKIQLLRSGNLEANVYEIPHDLDPNSIESIFRPCAIINTFDVEIRQIEGKQDFAARLVASVSSGGKLVQFTVRLQGRTKQIVQAAIDYLRNRYSLSIPPPVSLQDELSQMSKNLRKEFQMNDEEEHRLYRIELRGGEIGDLNLTLHVVLG